MSATPTQDTTATRNRRRQLRDVELQGMDASRIINGLSGRHARVWPSRQTAGRS